VRAKPIAATLEKLFVGQRSGVSPVLLSVCCQNQSKVRRSRVSRKAVCRGVSAEGGIGPLTLVIAVGDVAHAVVMKRSVAEDRHSQLDTDCEGPRLVETRQERRA
jgi:hypothetical protein